MEVTSDRKAAPFDFGPLSGVTGVQKSVFRGRLADLRRVALEIPHGRVDLRQSDLHLRD